jgi:hypothetical protein
MGGRPGRGACGTRVPEPGDLLGRLLEPEPSRRITLQQVGSGGEVKSITDLWGTYSGTASIFGCWSCVTLQLVGSLGRLGGRKGQEVETGKG